MRYVVERRSGSKFAVIDRARSFLLLLTYDRELAYKIVAMRNQPEKK